jgi:hypothetical protein
MMPYPTVHMFIAKKIVELNPDVIENLPQYYLGSLAPDAVHFRENFKAEDKFISHLCIGNERWGEISNNEEWTDNVLTFLKKHKESENIDFLYGYCAHVLSDMRNNIDIWSPLKLKLYHSLKIPAEDVYDSEVRKVLRSDEIDTDNRLYKTADFQNEILNFLSKAKGIALEEIIIEEEVNGIRDNILYNQYKDISSDDSYVGKYITYEAYLNFIDKTAKLVSEMMFSRF